MDMLCRCVFASTPADVDLIDAVRNNRALQAITSTVTVTIFQWRPAYICTRRTASLYHPQLNNYQYYYIISIIKQSEDRFHTNKYFSFSIIPNMIERAHWKSDFLLSIYHGNFSNRSLIHYLHFQFPDVLHALQIRPSSIREINLELKLLKHTYILVTQAINYQFPCPVRKMYIF